MKLLADGKILIAGTTAYFIGIHDREDQIALARLNPDGTLDQGFGKSGILKLRSDDGIAGETLIGIAPQADEGVVVVSSHQVVKLGVDGKVDSGYGTGGTAQLGAVSLVSLHVDSGDALAVAGSSETQSQAGTCCAGSAQDAFFLAHLTPAGKADPAFSAGVGIARLGSAGEYRARAVLWEADGSVLIAGATVNLAPSCSLPYCPITPALARFDAVGNPDSGFGVGGLVRLERVAGGQVLDLLSRDSARLVAAGGGGPDGSVAFLAALDGRGALEPGFGDDGILGEREPQPSEQIGAPALAIARDGKILAADSNNAGVEWGPSIIRYTRNGHVDRSFNDGKGYSPSAGSENAVALAVDRGGASVLLTRAATVSKLTVGGRTDARFGDRGSTSLRPKKGSPHFRDVAVQPDGKILVAGTDNWLGRRGHMLVARLLSNGRLDPSFGHHGYATVGCRQRNRCKANRVLLQPDGRILLAGRLIGPDTGYGPYKEEPSRLALARLLPNGRPDPSFAHHGFRSLKVSGYSEARSLALLRGEILVGALTKPYRGSTGAVVRFRANGSLDHRFGRGGISRAFPRRSGFPVTVLQTAHRLLIVTNGKVPRVFALRPNGRSDRSYRRLPPRTTMHHLVSGPSAALQHGRAVLAWTQWSGRRKEPTIRLRLTRLTNR